VSQSKIIVESPLRENERNKGIKPTNKQYLGENQAPADEPTVQEQLNKAQSYIDKLEAQLKCFAA
jgi:hypothetical protein